MTDEQSLIKSHSQSLSEYERREDRLYNERMLVVMPEIHQFDNDELEQDLREAYDLEHADEKPYGTYL